MTVILQRSFYLGSSAVELFVVAIVSIFSMVAAATNECGNPEFFGAQVFFNPVSVEDPTWNIYYTCKRNILPVYS